MEATQTADHRVPTRREALSFFLKTRAFILRGFLDPSRRTPVHPRHILPIEARLVAEVRAPVWTQLSAAELPLTAGKIQNLRIACRALDGIAVPAGEVFSFWKQVGRITGKKGYVTGRELRSGCMVPSLGGGLCQVSGLLHHAALKAGLEIVESHRHSMSLPGTELPAERDATVFWNYVDLRFRAPFPWQLHARLTTDELIISIRGGEVSEKIPDPGLKKISGSPTRAHVEGDCLTCGVTSCFRHPAATAKNAPELGHTAFVLDGLWPEFDDWCARHAREGDRWLTPLEGNRFKKTNYAWTIPPGAQRFHPTFQTLKRSWSQRRLPAQGAIRQSFMIRAQAALAETFAREIDPLARHLVISQTLLPHLWKTGQLGGRTFDVLVNRWPLAELQNRLDRAARAHPDSQTLADFRAEPALVLAETEALAAAARIVTPHRAIAASFGAKALLLDWEIPEPFTPKPPPNGPATWFFPASPLARKGIRELATALNGSDDLLLILGAATEGKNDPLEKTRLRRATLADLPACHALVLPAWIEHEPRPALRALASGIPVIATPGCGLPAHPLLTLIPEGDVEALKTALAAHRPALA